MSLTSTKLKTKIKKKGYFNYRDLYAYAYSWLKDRGYGIKENEYTEKIDGASKEIQLDWGAGKAVTEYFKNSISVKWHILQLTDAEIERDGKKEKTNKGELKLDITADLVRDHEDRWEDKEWMVFWRGIYEKYVIRTTVEDYEDRLKADAVDFVNDLKAYLELN
jgi:hypothetical protein